MDNRLVSFLKNMRTTEGDYTHTSIITPRGKYKIIGDNLEKFHDIYCHVIKDNGVAGITEKTPTILPLIVDIDFRYDIDERVKRIYKIEHLKKIVQIYQDIIRNILSAENEKALICCVFEKIMPVIDKNRTKDGFHIQFPHFYVSKDVQKYYIRKEAINRLQIDGVFKELNLLESLDHIVDKNVPDNGWFMYGSRKSEKSEAYRLTNIYNGNLELISISSAFKKKFPSGLRKDNLARYLSVRMENPPTDIINVKLEKDDITPKKRITIRDKTQIVEDLVEAEKLMDFIDEFRADDYTKWMEVGWILYNISEGDKKGLDLWIEFSKKSDKYKDGECEKLWEKMQVKNYTLASLKYFAKFDSPDAYHDYTKFKIKGMLERGFDITHSDIANIVHTNYEGQFVCADIEKDIWYEFRGHKWVKIVKGITLRKLLSTELVNQFALLMSNFSEQMIREMDTNKKMQLNAKVAQISGLIKKLKSVPFKNNIMKECQEFFYDPSFVERMDENPALLVCENGVYDAENDVFRDGRPNDYCTKSTKINFKEYKDGDPIIKELNKILDRIFVDNQLKKFFRQTTGDLIRGGNKHKIFSIWTGMGDNGKSICSDLIEKALGDYFYTPPTSILTSKQHAPSNATSELMPCKGVRVVVASETDNADVLNCGIMKKLTGGDPFYARGLFKEPIQITPQFKLILHCNRMPNISAEDKASWNRIRVLLFESTFVKKTAASLDQEEQITQKIFPMDKKLKNKIMTFAEPFLWWMIHEYRIYKDKELYEPKKVKIATDAYHRTNDHYMQFMEECIAVTDNKKDYTTLSSVYSTFKKWFNESYPGRAIPSRLQVKDSLEKKIGVCTKGVWRGVIVYNPSNDVCYDEEEETLPNDVKEE